MAGWTFLGEEPKSWILFIVFLLILLAIIHYVLDELMER